MASCSSKSEDATKQLLHCTVCLKQYQQPKQLPCLHRYCRDCLEQRVERREDVAVISCPECTDEFTVPVEGVDGFKTDLYMVSVIDNMKLQKFIIKDGIRKCHSCTRKMKMASYCSKCEDFLCHDCQDYHMTNNTLRDHRGYVIGKSLDARRCQSHPEFICQLCCKTCCNLPICLQCTSCSGSHKTHDTTDLSTLEVEQELEILDQLRTKLKEMSERMERMRDGVISDVTEKKRNYQIQYDSDVSKLRRKIQTSEFNYELKKVVVKERYERILEEIKKQSEDELKNLEKECNDELKEKYEKLQLLDYDLKAFMFKINSGLYDRIRGLDDISQRIFDAEKRYENLTETARSALAKESFWSSMPCVPGVCESTLVEIGREISQLENSSNIHITLKVKEDDIFVANIEGIKQNDWFITSMSGSNDGNIVISGPTSIGYQSHITVINTEGKVLRQTKIKASVKWAYRACAYFSQHLVSTVCWPNEIGLYNVTDGSYIKRNISGIVCNWPVRRYVRCVAADTVTNRIVVGAYESRDVYIFDDDLDFCYTVTLPNVIEYPWNVTVTEDKLLVCDFSGKGAYIINMVGSEAGKVLHELESPNVDGCEWRPFSVCTETKGSIYMLWEGKISNEWKCYLAQYSNTGQRLPAVIALYNDARCVTTIAKDKREQVAVATLKSGKLITYNLISVCV